MKYKNFKKNIWLTLVYVLLFLISPFIVNAVVEDDFERSDSSTLGTATNGNVWSEAGSFELKSGESWNNNPSGTQLAKLELSNKSSDRYDFQWKIEGNSNVNYITLCSTLACASGDQAIIFYMIGGELKYYDGGWVSFDTPFTPSNNVMYDYSVRNIDYGADTFDLYVDNVLKETSGSFRNDKAINYFVQGSGTTDIYLDNLCSGGFCTSLTPSVNTTISILSITANGNAFVNNTYFGTVDILFNVTYEVNDTYAGVFTNSTLTNLTSLLDGNYTIQWNVTYNTTSVLTDLYYYFVSLIPPTINNSIPTEINSYEFLSSYFSCSSTNLVYCNISIDSLNKDSNTSFNLTHNGNLSYTISAQDIAGNQANETGILFVNPYQYFYFEDGSPVTNFTFNSIVFNDYANFTTYNLGLGDKNLTFVRLGYATTYIVFNLNTTSDINLSTSVTNSKIIVSLYDRETEALITGTSYITLVATTGYNTTTKTGKVNITDINFINELYHLIVNHENYTTESTYFTYDNRQNLNVNVYMLSNSSTDSGYITIQALSDTGYRVQGAICSALEWKPALSSYQSVAEGLTNINGETNLNIEINTKLYKFSCTKNGATAFSSPAIITATAQTLPIVLETTIIQPANKVGGTSGSFTSTTYNSTHDRLTFSFVDENSLILEGCINTYRVAGTTRTLINTTCVSGDSGQIQTIVPTNNTYDLFALASVSIDSQNIPIDTIVYESNQSLSTGLKDYHLDIVIPLLLILIGVVFGLVIQPQNIYISEIAIIVMVWFSVLIVPSVISTTIALFVTVIAGFMLWGGAKPK